MVKGVLERESNEKNLNLSVSSVGFLSFSEKKKEFSLDELLRNSQFVMDGRRMIEVCCSHSKYPEGLGLKNSICRYMMKTYNLDNNRMVEVSSYFFDLCSSKLQKVS